MESFSSPFEHFHNWYEEALKKVADNPQAMTVATVHSSGAPSLRTVLLRDHSEQGLTFFTNYNSRKSQELLANPQTSILFYWRGLERQIRVEGKAEKTSAEVSDAYWNSRHPQSQINSAFSKQSSIMENETEVEKKLSELSSSFGDKGHPRPENWGGFLIKPTYFEFWNEGPNRWHHRQIYQLQEDKWVVSRLYP